MTLHATRATLGIQHRVHFVGARRDLGNILGAIDFFAMPSLWEGLPLSLVLAMGAGLPVVAHARGRHSRSRSARCQRLAGRPRRQRAGSAQALARLVATRRCGARSARAARAFVLPRFGVDGYVDVDRRALRSPAAAKGCPPPLKLPEDKA